MAKTLNHILARALCGGALLAGVAAGLGGGTALAQAAPDDPNTIVMSGNAFVAPELTVPVGATVTWLNMDGEQHDVVAGDFTSFESPPVDPGTAWQFTFTAPGTYSYLCDLHANMEGTITVVATAGTTEDGADT